MPHRAQPAYQGSTKKISYKLFDIELFWDALEEQSIVPFTNEALFAGNEQCNDDTEVLSVEEEIERAKQQSREGLRRKRSSSKSSLIVGYGEGRATREIELIWWPNLYRLTNHGRLVIRIYISKCEF